MLTTRRSLCILASFFLLAVAFASGQSLTQVQDTVLNSDGTTFNGTVVITWNGAANSSSTSPLSTSARIYNGALSVLLVPTTTASSASFYQVSYYGSAGVVVWTEIWQVPPSSTPLTLSQVRTATTQGSGGGTGTTSGTGATTGGQYATLPIAITQVTSLSADLASINAAIASLSAQINILSSSAGSNVQTGAAFIDGESPAGTLDGNNTAFTLSQSPINGSVALYRNGLLQSPGVDYTLSGSGVTFLSVSVPRPTDLLIAYYRTAGSGPAATFVDSEVPSGTIDGNNLAFTLAAAPSPALSLKLYKNGVLLNQGGDYSVTGSSVSFASTTSTPQPGDALIATYRH